MIVVDSSAVIAVLEAEDDALAYARAIQGADRLLISAVNVHETGIVMQSRRGAAGLTGMWRFLVEDNDFDIVAFDRRQVEVALTAFAKFGKGVDPRAKLNLADCAAYALATSLDIPLLFQGQDFAATDVKIQAV